MVPINYMGGGKGTCNWQRLGKVCPNVLCFSIMKSDSCNVAHKETKDRNILTFICRLFALWCGEAKFLNVFINKTTY